MASPPPEPSGQIGAHLRYWATAGIEYLRLPEAPQLAAEVPTQMPTPITATPVPQVTAPMQSAQPQPVNSSAADPLTVLADELNRCTACTLAPGRTHIVFGVGDPNARVVFVGEAPGRDEDLSGEPFVGRAGKLLTDIIEKGMKVPRSAVYICNTVKCRPPDNRNPTPTELATCEPFLIRQLAAIRPRVIVALGKYAAQSLCRSDTPITRLRGNWHDYEGMAVMPTFHPAYLLRNQSAKKEVWADIQAVLKRLKETP